MIFSFFMLESSIMFFLQTHHYGYQEKPRALTFLFVFLN